MQRGLNAPLFCAIWFFLQALPSHAQNAATRFFATQAACVSTKSFSVEDCRNAHLNALAELDERAPRFSSRGVCEKIFERCSIAGVVGRKVDFSAALKGFEIRGDRHGGSSVFPVLYANGDKLKFQGRQMQRLDTHISVVLRPQADAFIAELRKQADVGARPEPVDATDPGIQAEPTETLAKPSSPTQYDLESAARRRQEILTAPLIR